MRLRTNRHSIQCTIIFFFPFCIQWKKRVFISVFNVEITDNNNQRYKTVYNLICFFSWLYSIFAVYLESFCNAFSNVKEKEQKSKRKKKEREKKRFKILLINVSKVMRWTCIQRALSWTPFTLLSNLWFKYTFMRKKKKHNKPGKKRYEKNDWTLHFIAWSK